MDATCTVREGAKAQQLNGALSWTKRPAGAVQTGVSLLVGHVQIPGLMAFELGHAANRLLAFVPTTSLKTSESIATLRS